MKKRIIGFVYAILIVFIVISQYINAIWPSAIPVLSGTTAFFLIIALSFFWLELYPNRKKLSYYMLIVVADIALLIYPTGAIENYFMRKNKTIQLGYVLNKNMSRIGTKGGGTRDKIVVITDTLRASLSVERATFKKINVGDTIIVKVSSRGHIDYKNLFPTHEEIERYKVPQHYINGKLQENPICESDSVQ